MIKTTSWAPLKTSTDPSQSEKGRDEAIKKRVFRGALMAFEVVFFCCIKLDINIAL
jgi:hypothetical protein